jgi:vancomycin resistance protein YoaR
VSVSSTLPQRKSDPIRLLMRLAVAATTAGAALLAGVVVFLLAIRLAYAGRAYPGVSAAGISLAGMDRSQIETALAQRLTYPDTGLVVFQDGSRLWPAHPIELGVLVDTPRMAERALFVGRTGSLAQRFGAQVVAWAQGEVIPPIVLFDQRLASSYLQGLAAQIDQPTVEAALRLRGLTVDMIPGQIGRRVDVPATLERLIPVVTLFHDAAVPLTIVETPPEVLDASQQAAVASAILSQPLRLTAEGAEPWTLEPEQLASMMRFSRVGAGPEARLEVALDPEPLAAFLTPLAAEVDRPAENARFIFNDDTRQLDLLRDAVVGRALDVTASIQAINDGLNAGLHEIPLVFQSIQPRVGSDATAEELGITENVVAVSTYFVGSSPARIQNITTASQQFHGLLVAPGETLSMADVLGDISLDTGYAEALIIYGDRTINGVGGGVCQVSTTLFRAAFFGGYQIDERNPHAYRVLYYEQRCSLSPSCAGFDATVFAPLVDFRFTNDSPYWLLLETYIYGNQLLWKIYSTSDGRTVQYSSTGLTNVVEHPESLYRENPDLEPGEIKQVDYAADGADVVVTRTVTRDGTVIHQDRFSTHYLPWRAIYEFGPGTELPPGANVANGDEE